MCGEHPLRHGGLVLRMEVVLLKNHRMKMATTDGAQERSSKWLGGRMTEDRQ